MDFENDIVSLWKRKRLFKIENNRLKEKKYIYISFPILNKSQIYADDLRKHFYADSLCRINRMLGYNVISGMGYNDVSKASFTEQKNKNNAVDMDIEALNYYRLALLKAGIGFDSDKELKLNSQDYLKFIQSFFILLYKNQNILYKERKIPVSNSGKLVNTFDLLDLKETEYTYQTQKAFFLNVEKYIPSIANLIEKIEMADNYKQRLLSSLNPTEVLEIKLYSVDMQCSLDIEMDNPQFMGGINFICLNPALINVTAFIANEERISVSTYLDTPYLPGVFSGTFLRNPLTNSSIPVIIAQKFKEAIHVGIPDTHQEDYDYCNALGLDITQITEENYIINSDFISELTILDAKQRIVTTFCDEEIACKKIKYYLQEILISQDDGYGILIPMVQNVNDDSISLLDVSNIPVYFSPKYRPIISRQDSLDNSLELVKGTLNSLFSSGLACYAMKYNENKIGISSPFNDEVPFLSEFQDVDYSIINQHELYKEVLMPLLFNEILKDYYKVDSLGCIKKVIVVGNVLDTQGHEFNKKNNNLITLEMLNSRYFMDTYRLYSLGKNLIEGSLELSLPELMPYQRFLADVTSYYEKSVFVNTSNSLELPVHKLIKTINQDINTLKYVEAIRNIIAFFEINMIKFPMTKKQALDYLLLLSPFAPIVCEKIYQSKFATSSSFIVFEDWPN